MGNLVFLAAGAVTGLVCFWILMRSPVVGVYVMGLLIPFQIFLASSANYEDLTLAFLVSQATFVIVFFKQVVERKLTIKASPFALPIAAFIVVKVLSMANSSDLSISWQEIKTLIAFLAIFTAVFYSMREEKQVRHAVAALLISGVLSCLLGFKQALGTPQDTTDMMASPVGALLNGSWIKELTDPGWWYSAPTWQMGHQTRVVGPFFNPDYYAAYLGVMITLCLGLLLFAKKTLQKIILLVLFTALLINLIMTHSRGGYITLVISIGAMIIVAVRMGKPLKWLAALPVMALIPAAIVVPIIIHSGSVVDTITRCLDLQNDARLMIWGIFWSKIGAHPILGHGLNRVFPVPNCPWMGASHAHNLYLQLLYATGAVGLGTFMWLVVTWFRGSIRACDIAGTATARGLTLGLFGACVWLTVHSVVDYNFLQIKNGMLWWYVLGLSAAVLHRLDLREHNAYASEQSSRSIQLAERNSSGGMRNAPV